MKKSHNDKKMAAGTRRIEGIRKQTIETGRNRLLVTGMVLTMAFSAIAARLVDLTVLRGSDEPILARTQPAPEAPVGRADIVDRNGVILATSLPTVSLYADPSAVLDAEEAARRVAEVLPDIDVEDVLARLNGGGRFVWISRNLTPNQHYAVNRLGLPGFDFQRGERRVYPHGRTVAHVLGLTDVDGRGIAGLEAGFDRALRSGERVRLGLDVRIQAMLRGELISAVREFEAIGASGVVLDVNSGEIVAMVSLPDFDPNNSDTAQGDAAFNRATKGVYEMGSTFKLFTAAMALDSGTVNLQSGYDASEPIRVARFTIRDFHAKNRWLSVPEIIVHSSNIGAAKMAVDVGTKVQRSYLDKFGLLAPAAIELPEVGRPLMPARWREINTMTIAYGHGIAVSPLQLAAGVATLVNGGLFVPPTLLDRNGRPPLVVERVLSTETSAQMRDLMRLVVRHGTGRKAAADGYAVGGKTGTADKLAVRGYRKDATISSFVGAFPMGAPRFVVLALIDEPKGNARTFNYATGGWVAAPAVGRVVERMAPLIGMAPDRRPEPEATAIFHQARAKAPTPPRASPPSASRAPNPNSSNEHRIMQKVRAVLAETGPPAAGSPTPGALEQALATR